MIDTALATHRLIRHGAAGAARYRVGLEGGPLSAVGCLGRITSFSETGDGRYIISLTGVCRFRLLEEVASAEPIAASGRRLSSPIFRVNMTRRLSTGKPAAGFPRVPRCQSAGGRLGERLSGRGNRVLVNSLSMMSPFGPAGKQALLEAPDLKTRAETLIAITEIVLAQGSGEGGTVLQ